MDAVIIFQKMVIHNSVKTATGNDNGKPLKIVLTE